MRLSSATWCQCSGNHSMTGAVSGFPCEKWGYWGRQHRIRRLFECFACVEDSITDLVRIVKAIIEYSGWSQDTNTGFSMNVLFYDPNSEFSSIRNSKAWNEWMRSLNIYICATMADVVDHLRTMGKRPHVAIFCVIDQQLMRVLLSQKELLMDISIILVLPHDKSDVLRMAYRLQPRYIDFIGNRKDTLLSILKSMTTVA